MNEDQASSVDPHVYEPNGHRDKYVQRCQVCNKGRMNRIHR